MNYLFPNSFKKIGWIILIPSAIVGLWTIFTVNELEFFYAKVLAFISDKESLSLNEFIFFTVIENYILDEISGMLFIIGSLFVAFSKEKKEDEFIEKIRLESLVWATYFNFAILLIALFTVYDSSFYWFMMLNMFTIPVFFIIRFNWQLRKIKHYEK